MSRSVSEITFSEARKELQKQEELQNTSRNYINQGISAGRELAFNEAKKLAIETNEFAGLMIDKLIYKAKTGWSGWDKADYTDSDILKQIKNHLKRMESGENQSIDIANLCMFYWYKTKGEPKK